MVKHWNYLKYVLRHKYFVFIECCRLGIPFRGIVHDWSKFTPYEWFPYVEYFYGTADVKCALDYAWNAHQKRTHHFQYWMLTSDSTGETKLLEIPDTYRREMLADWHAVSFAQGKTRADTLEWYNTSGVRLHPNTKQWIEERLLKDATLH